MISFDPNLYIMSSLRRPKKFIIYTNDDIHLKSIYMIKSGEDLRLDSCIQSIFKVMNILYQQQSTQTNEHHHINSNALSTLYTYQIFPLNTQLGLIEWISNTITLKSFINQSYNSISSIMNQYLNNLREIYDDYSSVTNAASLFITSIKEYQENKQHDHILTTKFMALTRTIQDKSPIKQSFQLIANTIEHYHQYITNCFHSLICLNISCYMLGIGDRHLDNFLIDKVTGQVIAIDFGCSFSQGLQLPIPELIPFRYTSSLSSLTNTIDHNHYLYKLYTHKYVKILRQLSSYYQITTLLSAYIHSLNDTIQSKHMLSAIQYVQMKLKGINPIYIMSKELQHIHHHQLYHKSLQLLLNVDTNDQAQIYTIEKQVNILIDLATSNDILCRTWVGWASMI